MKPTWQIIEETHLRPLWSRVESLQEQIDTMARNVETALERDRGSLSRHHERLKKLEEGPGTPKDRVRELEAAIRAHRDAVLPRKALKDALPAEWELWAVLDG